MKPARAPAHIHPQTSSSGSILGWVFRIGGLLVFAGVWVYVGGFLLPKPKDERPPQPQGQNEVVIRDKDQSQPSNEMMAGDSDDSDEPSDVPEDLDTFVVTATTSLTRPKAEPIVMPELPPGGGPLELAVAIDKELDRALSEAKVPASPLADDAEFLRRASLDITGRIPSYDQTVAFLASKDPHKRSKLIDELLASPHYGRHFANIWCDLLVKHDFDNNKGLKTEAFVAWLSDKFNQSEKWDKIVAALMTAEGKESQSPATFFLLANQDNNQPSPAKLVGATGNLFMGIQIQCCECHVHPFNSKWKPTDFWGMAAFYGHVRADRDADAKGKPKPGTANLMEVERRAEPKGKAAKKNGDKAIMAGASIAIPDPTNPKKTLATAPAKFFEGAKPSLGSKVPYRPHLAHWVASDKNPYFAPAMVNRTWAHFFARGFVNPIDDIKDDNPPSHPGVLKLLASEFTRSGYDLKYLIKTICNTRAYQRTSRPLPDNSADDKLFSHLQVKVLTAEMLLDSLALATSHEIAKGGGSAAGRKQMPVANSTVRYFDTREPDDDPTDYSYGVPQVLRLMNTGLTNSGNEVVSRLTKAGTPKEKVIEDIFLTTLSRRPSDSEQKRMLEYVAKQKDPLKGYAGVFWALLNSAEFACNR